MSLRVLHIIRSLHRSGAERICLDICNELNTRKDIQVLLISMSDINEYEELTKKIPFKIINSKVFPKIFKKSIIEIDDYKKVIDDFKPNIVHSHLFWSELLSREYSKNEITYVTHCHDNMVELNNISFSTMFNKLKLVRFFEKKWILNKYSNCNNYFLTISKHTQNYFENVLPNSLVSKSKLIPNAIRLQKFQIKSKRSYKLNNSKLKLINIGSFWPKKNQQFLLQVVSKLKSKNIDVELKLLGDGPEKENIINQVKNLNLESSIKILGNVKNVEEELFKSDLYVHSALYEPFGLVLIEAMAAGLPIVTINGKGNSDLITNNFNGFILNNPTVNLFTEKILSIVNSKELYEKFSENASTFSKKFSIENYTDQLIKWYNEIHERGK
ncbi:MAG: hypothetical protein CL846_04950 [Crocinitomicaceae bacterium]|nr:hypothetical protein [Crocinitomicaceae bacterium]